MKPINIAKIVLYTPTAQIREEKIDNIYKSLDNIKALCKSLEITNIMGNRNAKSGKERNGEIVGKSGLGPRNQRDEWRVQGCTAND